MSDLWHKLSAETAAPTYRFGTRRAVPPAETLRRITPLLPLAGITRLADVTGLDWVGMPVYQAIRPNSRSLAVSQGKGLTRAQAQVSALMEALESFHGEDIRQPTVRATVREMRPRLGYDPYTLPAVRNPLGHAAWGPDYDRARKRMGEPALLRDDIPLDWVAATDMWSGAASWVPKQLVCLDFTVDERIGVPLFFASSNGLASGNTLLEALTHGLCEAIERDSSWRCAATRYEPERCVAPATITSALARSLIERFARAGLATIISDVSGPIGLPCFEATIAHPDAPSWYGGAGCHPSRATALLRALTEAAQSRLTIIAGSRDDILRGSYRKAIRARQAIPHLFLRSYRSAPALPHAPMPDTLREIVRRVRAYTGASPLAVDLTRPEFGLPVVHVVAPGLRMLEEG